MNIPSLQIISYAITILMLSTSVIYFVVTYEQFTDESGDGIHEIVGEKEGHGTSDFDKYQWDELDLGGKVQTIFFLVVATIYIPVGILMIRNSNNEKSLFIALVGSGTLIVFYIISRTVDLPIVGIQSDVNSIDIVVKILQGGIIACSSYLLMTRRKLKMVK